MIFTIAANLAIFLLAPLGSVSLVLGDWIFNTYLVAKVIENFVPNGPAIVGNVSSIFPVVFNIVRSTVEPALKANYSGLIHDAAPDFNMTEWTDHMKQYILNATTQYPIHAD